MLVNKLSFTRNTLNDNNQETDIVSVPSENDTLNQRVRSSV